MVTFGILIFIFKFETIFSLLLIADASSAGNLGCEIRAAASCSLSRDGQYANQTVKLDSHVTLNCSIRNNGTTLGKTWEQVNKTINPKYGLILKQRNSTTRIYFTRKLIYSLVCCNISTHEIINPLNNRYSKTCSA